MIKQKKNIKIYRFQIVAFILTVFIGGTAFFPVLDFSAGNAELIPGTVAAYADNTSNILKSIKFKKFTMADEILIQINKYKGYKITRMKDPDRLVVDIPGGIVSKSGKIDIGGCAVATVSYSQLFQGVSRIVLYLGGPDAYKAIERQGSLIIVVNTNALKKVDYYTRDDRACILLKNIKLTDGYDENRKDFYSSAYSSDGLAYTIAYNAGLGDPGDGEIVTDDRLTDSILFKTDSENGYVTITFTSKVKLAYNVIYRPETHDTAITAVDPFSDAEQGVVIDAGHGGVDPGAEYKDLVEKNVNLDIALRLNKLLIAKNIKTYMIRDDDRFIGVYERALIANKMNASLFLSIHNNSLQYPSYRGTMTLYYPSADNSGKFTGKDFAGILNAELVKMLGTVNHGIVERPGLAAIRETVMPASIVEIAYLTNVKDRTLLRSSAFRQKAAQALCNSVLKSLAKTN